MQFWSYIKDAYYATIRFVLNLYRFRKILTSYYPWDFCYFLELYKLHLELYIKGYEDEGYNVLPEDLEEDDPEYQIHKKQVHSKYLSAKLALKLISRLIEESYFKKQEEAHYAKYPIPSFESFFSKDKKERDPEQIKELVAILRMQDSRRQRDLEILAKLQAKYLLHWWT
jgi:hypothetical protein